MYKDFKKSPDNPFNQATVAFDATKEEKLEALKKLRAETENRYAICECKIYTPVLIGSPLCYTTDCEKNRHDFLVGTTIREVWHCAICRNLSQFIAHRNPYKIKARRH